VNPAKARLLLVDDNEDNLYTLSLHLKRIGYAQLETAGNGRQALERMQVETFDLVLLDIMMPEMDGFQVLEHLKADATLREIPVIMISALDEIESVVRCVELGAEDYLQKPFNSTLLRARVGASLEKKRLRDEVRASLDRLEVELEAARQLQLGMLPQDFTKPTPARPVEVFAMMEPAQEVGGDFYDFFYCPDGSFCFLVGDVMGKGVAAGMFMARTKSLVRMAADLIFVPGAGADLADVVVRVNRELCENNSEEMFVTLFVGIIPPEGSEFSYCNAAHNLPYRLRDGEINAIAQPQSPALGFMDDTPYRSDRLTLEPADMLLVGPR